MAPSQLQHRQSPRPKSKQAPAVATPISKKPSEYAGPSFNHSPAPANLPPPPFLSKSLPTRDAINFGGRLSPPLGASPLSFLFNAKQKEDSLQQLNESRPPSINYKHDGRSGFASESERVRSGGSLFDMSSDDKEVLKQEHTLVKDIPAQEPAASGMPARPKASQKSPWAAIERPESINILNPPISTPEPAQDSGRSGVSLGRSQPKTEGVLTLGKAKVEDTKVSANVKSKKTPNNETPRKRRSTKASPGSEHSTPKTPAAIAPKTILKREAGQPTPPSRTRVSETDQRMTREAQPSAFRPVQKRSQAETLLGPSSRPQQIIGTSEEEDLRQQAANLMAILRLKPTSDVAGDQSPTRIFKKSPIKNDAMSANSSSSNIESDLRRMLQLGA